MTYKLRNETYDDDQLDEMTDGDLDLLRADCKAEKASIDLAIKSKQLQFKKGLGPGATGPEHAEREYELAQVRLLEYQIEYLLLERVHNK